MNEAVKGKQLVERYNRFVEYRKDRKKEAEPFGKRLSELSKQAPEGEGAEIPLPQPETRSPSHAVARGARRFQPPKLAKAKGITTVQASRLSRLAPLIEGAARRHNVPVELICGVILQESGGNHRAVSSAGAKGLMQLMPGTAKRFGVTDPYNPAQNIEGGTKYLRWLLDRFDGNIELALAGYNAGEGNVEKYGKKVPPFAETKAYIPNVLGYTQSMIDILYAKMSSDLPVYARKV
jgi:soluble lytic murein transglycosylase-like protein